MLLHSKSSKWKVFEQRVKWIHNSQYANNFKLEPGTPGKIQKKSISGKPLDSWRTLVWRHRGQKLEGIKNQVKVSFRMSEH